MTQFCDRCLQPIQPTDKVARKPTFSSSGARPDSVTHAGHCPKADPEAPALHSRLRGAP